jgi:Glycoside hydrolase family 44
VLGTPRTPGDVGSVDVTLEVRTDGELRRIAPEIYGTNGAPDIANNRQAVVRSGGNRMTAYNWENNASNAGSDWMFQNDSFLSMSNEPAKVILDGVAEAHTHGAAAIVTVPIVDYVAADKNGNGDVRNSGSDYLTTRFKQNKAEKSGSLGTPDAGDAYVYQDEFVAYLKARAPSGSRIMFSMDNEPDLWSATHAEVHPAPVTYSELWERNQRYASAVKKVWPEALVLGFVSYGFNGYVTLQNAPDKSKGDFIEWYLDQAKADAEQRGGRLIDYLDLHWYPEAQGGGMRITEASNDAAVVTAREQAPRSLWDDEYVEQSWIAKDYYQNAPIVLLPRLQQKIESHYAGTQLAFTEWNYGGGDHISGAIACADVLGIFGRYGVGLATYWPLHENETFAYAAFRAYRNYDGKGAAFGDVALTASTTDKANVSVYGGLDSSQTERVVVVVINKAASAKTAGLKLAHPAAYGALARYELSGTSAQLASKPEVPAKADNAWVLMLPAQSVTVLVPQL